MHTSPVIHNAIPSLCRKKGILVPSTSQVTPDFSTDSLIYQNAVYHIFMFAFRRHGSDQMIRTDPISVETEVAVLYVVPGQSEIVSETQMVFPQTGENIRIRFVDVTDDRYVRGRMEKVESR